MTAHARPLPKPSKGIQLLLEAIEQLNNEGYIIKNRPDHHTTGSFETGLVDDNRVQDFHIVEQDDKQEYTLFVIKLKTPSLTKSK